MQLKRIIQALAAIWLVLFVASFVTLQTTEPSATDTSGLGRVVAFLTWQVIAFVVAALGAFATRYAVLRGAERIKLVGYAPLASSVFLVASFVAIMAVRLYIVPMLEGLGVL